MRTRGTNADSAHGQRRCLHRRRRQHGTPPRAAPPNALDGDDQIGPEGALRDGFDGDDGGPPPVQDYDDLRGRTWRMRAMAATPVQDYASIWPTTPEAGDAEAADMEEQEQTAARQLTTTWTSAEALCAMGSMPMTSVAPVSGEMTTTICSASPRHVSATVPFRPGGITSV